MKSHEKLLQSASALSLLIMIIACTGASGQARETLDPMLVPRFENSMPVIQDAGLRVDLTRGGRINVEIVETEQDLLGLGTMTKVWDTSFRDYLHPIPARRSSQKKIPGSLCVGKIIFPWSMMIFRINIYCQ